MSEKLREIVILHSNDIHGKFTGRLDETGKEKGSLAQVAGYVSKIKKEYPYTLYCIAGDVLDISEDELTEKGGLSVIAPDAFEVLKNYFSGHSGLGGYIDDRIIIR